MFLDSIQNKYNLFNLVHVIKNRSQRCCMERIMGVIFHLEFKQLVFLKSLLGHIFSYMKWGYTIQEHLDYVKKFKRAKHPVIKVWTGR